MDLAGWYLITVFLPLSHNLNDKLSDDKNKIIDNLANDIRNEHQRAIPMLDYKDCKQSATWPAKSVSNDI